MAKPFGATHRSTAALAQVRRLVATLEAGDEEAVTAALVRLSRSRRALAPLALAVGAFAMLFRGLELLWVNWRLLLVEALPAMWVWAAMLDLKAHVLRGHGFAPIGLLEQAVLAAAAMLVTAISLYLNVVFAFAISERPPTAVRTALAAARRSIRTVAVVGFVVGAALGVSAFVVPTWGLGWFSLALGVSLGAMMLAFVVVPSRLLGATKTGSRRDRFVAGVLASVLGAVVCTPSYALGRFGLVLVGSHGLWIVGTVLLVVGFGLQSGASGAVKAIKLSATLVSGPRSPAHPDGSPAHPDGSPAHPDGSLAQPDGSPARPDGSPAQPDLPAAQSRVRGELDLRLSTTHDGGGTLARYPRNKEGDMTTTSPTTSQRELRSTDFTPDGAPSRPATGEGWLLFAGIALLSAGVMRLFDALWAFHYHGVVPLNLQDALFGRSLNTYGWLWVGVAVILGLAGVGVMLRNQIGRWVGVGAAVIGAVTAIWWMPYYPVWSLTYIGIGVLVVYALVAHGERTAAGA